MAQLYVIKFVRRKISEGLRQKFFVFSCPVST